MTGPVSCKPASKNCFDAWPENAWTEPRDGCHLVKRNNNMGQYEQRSSAQSRRKAALSGCNVGTRRLTVGGCMQLRGAPGDLAPVYLQNGEGLIAVQGALVVHCHCAGTGTPQQQQEAARQAPWYLGHCRQCQAS